MVTSKNYLIMRPARHDEIMSLDECMVLGVGLFSKPSKCGHVNASQKGAITKGLFG